MWTSAYGGSASSNAFVFNCQNLADYGTKVAPLEDEDERTEMCQSRAIAAGAGFTADQFLPYSGFVKMGGRFDLQSIMLYTSTTGGALVNGAKQTVYTLANGNLITTNGAPSPGDVQNINDLYPAAQPQGTPCLYFQACSPFLTVFRAIQGCFTGS